MQNKIEIGRRYKLVGGSFVVLAKSEVYKNTFDAEVLDCDDMLRIGTTQTFNTGNGVTWMLVSADTNIWLKLESELSAANRNNCSAYARSEND